MGTRADFYVGRGLEADWLGSVAMDGYPDGFSIVLRTVSTEPEWRQRVGEMLRARDDATTPDQGWPWPWDDSRTTDYAYAFDGGGVWASYYGGAWFPADQPEPDDDESEPYVPPAKVAVFPNMADRKNVQIGGKRSGLLVVSAPLVVPEDC